MIIIWKDTCFSWSIGYECMLNVIASFNTAFRINFSAEMKSYFQSAVATDLSYCLHLTHQGGG